MEEITQNVMVLKIYDDADNNYYIYGWALNSMLNNELWDINDTEKLDAYYPITAEQIEDLVAHSSANDPYIHIEVEHFDINSSRLEDVKNVDISPVIPSRSKTI